MIVRIEDEKKQRTGMIVEERRAEREEDVYDDWFIILDRSLEGKHTHTPQTKIF